LDDCGADTTILVVMQVTAAETDRGNVEEDLCGLPLTQVERRYLGIPRAADEEGFAHLK
jgi:hypothetical protein